MVRKGKKEKENTAGNATENEVKQEKYGENAEN